MATQKKKLSLVGLAAELGNQITRQQLGRFIKEKDYVPTEERICELLDLYADPNPYRILPRWWERTPEALAAFNKTRAGIGFMYEQQRESIKAARNGK